MADETIVKQPGPLKSFLAGAGGGICLVGYSPIQQDCDPLSSPMRWVELAQILGAARC
jgi:hypothetical protein